MMKFIFAIAIKKARSVKKNSGLVFHKINQSGYNLLVQEIKYIKL